MKIIQPCAFLFVTSAARTYRGYNTLEDFGAQPSHVSFGLPKMSSLLRIRLIPITFF